MKLQCQRKKQTPSAVIPNLFGTRDWFHGRQIFHGPGGGGWFQDDSSAFCYYYCAYFHYYYLYYYYISSTSDHQALDPGDWGPLPQSGFQAILAFSSLDIMESHPSLHPWRRWAALSVVLVAASL